MKLKINLNIRSKPNPIFIQRSNSGRKRKKSKQNNDKEIRNQLGSWWIVRKINWLHRRRDDAYRLQNSKNRGRRKSNSTAFVIDFLHNEKLKNFNTDSQTITYIHENTQNRSKKIIKLKTRSKSNSIFMSKLNLEKK